MTQPQPTSPQSAQPTQLLLPGTIQPRKYHDWTGPDPSQCARCGLARFKRSHGAPWRYHDGLRVSRRRPDCRPDAPRRQETDS